MTKKNNSQPSSPDDGAQNPIPESVRKARATLRGEALSMPSAQQDNHSNKNISDKKTPSEKDLFPVARTTRYEKEKQRKIVKMAPVGQYIEGKGIKLGILWKPEDQKGALKEAFFVFAAPEDLSSLKTFNQAAQHLAGMKNWHGHNGFNHKVKGLAFDEAVIDAIRNGSYQGEWFIPPLNLLKDLCNDRGRFKRELALRTEDNNIDDAHWYWSSSVAYGYDGILWAKNFADGEETTATRRKDQLSTRCVRVEKWEI